MGGGRQIPFLMNLSTQFNGSFQNYKIQIFRSKVVRIELNRIELLSQKEIT